MSNQEILEKAIKKAIDGGWQNYEEWYVHRNGTDSNDWFMTTLDGDHQYIYGLIFDHEFAKSLWGEHTETMTVQNNTLNVKQVIDMDGWQYHLQQLVIADDVFKYLGENV